MSLSKVLRISAVCLAALLPLTSAVAQPDLSGVEIETVKVADGIWMLIGAGGNIGVSAGEDGVFLIDDQYAPMTDKIRAAVGEISSQPIRFVLNTHWHDDHSGGNENLGKAGTLILAHDNVRERMSVEQFIAAFDLKVPPSPKAALPVVTFNDTITLHLNGQTIKAFHVPPSHTDGDSVVHFEEQDVVHTGDLYFNGMYPFIDYASGGNIEGVIAAVDRILAITGEKTKVIPGHGPLSNAEELRAYRAMLQGIHDAVAPMVAAGKSFEEVMAAKPTAAFDEVWGGGFLNNEAFVRILHAGMSQ